MWCLRRSGEVRGLWEHAVIGNTAFWGTVKAMQLAGLVGFVKGRQKNVWATDDPIFRGVPSKLWATDLLVALAAEHGVTFGAERDHWHLSKRARERRPQVDPADLVRVEPLEGDGGKRRLGARQRAAGHLPRGQSGEAERLRTEVVELNARVAAADVRGCVPPVFRRTFQGDLRLGGRAHALGPGNFQIMPERDRIADITIGGKPVAEVDVSACYLTIFLALTGTLAMPADPYAVPGLPRDAVKAWMTQTFGGGAIGGAVE